MLPICYLQKLKAAETTAKLLALLKKLMRQDLRLRDCRSQTSVIYDHLRRLTAEEGRTILMVDQNIMMGTEVADYIYVLELGANKIEGTKADFDAKYRDSIAEWLL